MACTSTAKHTDLRFVAENARDSIRPNHEANSIKIDESDLQSVKQK
jgi:hypothetical protein